MERADDNFIRLIQHVQVAVRCRDMALKEPECARGLNRCAARHSEQAGEIADWLAFEVRTSTAMDD